MLLLWCWFRAAACGPQAPPLHFRAACHHPALAFIIAGAGATGAKGATQSLAEMVEQSLVIDQMTQLQVDAPRQQQIIESPAQFQQVPQLHVRGIEAEVEI